jgi:soluble lytic murein transglycosylase
MPMPTLSLPFRRLSIHPAPDHRRRSGRLQKARRRIGAVLTLSLAASLCTAVQAQAPTSADDQLIVQAREALAKNDLVRLQALRDQALQARHPLAMWADYWALGARLANAQQAELEDFYTRWSGTYVEDRLRNDWLLELGKRRDWANFARDYPRFRMDDDLEVRCYALLTRHLEGQDVKAEALRAWHAQRNLDDGCQLLASTLAEAKQLKAGDIWHELRLSVASNRLTAAKTTAALLGSATARSVEQLIAQPLRLLKQRRVDPSGQTKELAVLALLRVASSDPDAAAAQLASRWARQLDDEQAAVAWAFVGRQAAVRLQDNADRWYQQAWKHQRSYGRDPQWDDDTLAWAVRAALRAEPMTRSRWGAVEQAIDAMSTTEQAGSDWTYWKARALLERARPGSRGEADRARARALLATLAGGLDFYAQLAAQDLNLELALPGAPEPLSAAERAQAAQTPGLQRGLRLAAAGLRSEGRREWNFTLRGMKDRELLAAAQMACDASDWQICINTSERTREQIDLNQRYPMPFADEIKASAQAQALDPAFVFGLIRQETRFMSTLRSSAGAAGLMQLMPGTARWTAKQIGMAFRQDQVTDIDTNLRLGTFYLKRVLDDFEGSHAMAAAGYNAGPGRPRRWRDGPVLDAAAWAENIPFNETRNYVKTVLGNAAIYARRMGAAPAPLSQRLGVTIGPRPKADPAPDARLP